MGLKVNKANANDVVESSGSILDTWLVLVPMSRSQGSTYTEHVLDRVPLGGRPPYQASLRDRYRCTVAWSPLIEVVSLLRGRKAQGRDNFKSNCRALQAPVRRAGPRDHFPHSGHVSLQVFVSYDCRSLGQPLLRILDVSRTMHQAYEWTRIPQDPFRLDQYHNSRKPSPYYAVLSGSMTSVRFQTTVPFLVTCSKSKGRVGSIH